MIEGSRLEYGALSITIIPDHQFVIVNHGTNVCFDILLVLGYGSHPLLGTEVHAHSSSDICSRDHNEVNYGRSQVKDSVKFNLIKYRLRKQYKIDIVITNKKKNQ